MQLVFEKNKHIDMRKLFVILFFTVLFAMQTTQAVVAYPYPVNVSQSDGTVLTLVMKGDERVAWAKTMDNYTLMRDKNSNFVYAMSDGRGGMIPSSFIAHNVGERTTEELNFLTTIDKNLFYSSEQVSIMKQYWEVTEDVRNKVELYREMNDDVITYKIIVILMSFNDYAFTTPQEDIEELFNQVGYSKNGHQGSVHDYFLASTFGKLNVQATVVGPYTAANSIQYYGENYENTHTDMHSRTLITEAVQFADEDVDFSEFANGGNIVPCVYVLYAGYAESSGNESYTIWPHQGQLFSPYYVDGVQVRTYSCSSEFGGQPNYSQPLTIGTICHEFSHALGQPDYYDTDYELNGSCFVPESWDIMSSGNYNNNGKCPPLWSAMERTVGSFITLEDINQSGTYTLPPLHSSNKAYKLSFPNSSEYFILENRQQVGWDTYTSGHGMLVFKVNPTVSGWQNNQVNAVQGSEGYLLISANNSNYVSGGNPFPGTSSKTSFTDETTPSSHSSTGGSLGKPLYHITENISTGNITFSLMDTTTYARIINSAVTFSSDTINMTASIVSNNLTVTSKGFCYSTSAYPTINDNVIISTSTGNNITNILTTYEPNTTYYIRAFVTTTNTNYGETFTIKTPCNSSSLFPNKVSFEEDEESLECWTQESTNYVSNKWQSVSTTALDDGVQGAASGEKFAYIHSYYNNWPNQQTMLITPPADVTVLSQPKLAFAHHQKGIGNQRDYLSVYYKTSLTGEWVLLQSYTNQSIETWKRDTITLPVKSKTLFIGFQCNLRGSHGIGIDDVEIIESNVNAFPVVVTNSINNITDNSANASISVTSTGYTPLERVGVVISDTPSPTIDNQVFMSNTTAIGSHQIDLTNLLPSQTYYLRAFAQNQGLVSYGDEVVFSTKCTRITEFPYTPSLNSSDTLCFDNKGGWYVDGDSYTFSSNNAGYTSKLILPILNLENRDNMTVTFSYKQTSSSVNPLKVLFNNGNNETEWEELATYNNAATSYTTVTINIPTDASHQSPVSYIAFESTSTIGGKVNVKDININATLQVPVVTTVSVNLSTYNSVQMIANVSYSGLSDVTARGVCYSSTNSTPTLADNVKTSGSGIGDYTVNITNLDLLTTYYLRAYATNAFGTTYGETYTITTLYYPIQNNVISESQDLCEGSVPARIQGSEPSGGDEEFEYLWISSTDSINWEPCNEGSVNYLQWYNPRQLFTTTYYRRIVTSGATIDTSNTVCMRISSASRGGNVFAQVHTAFMYDTIALELRAYNGEIQYWEYKRPYYDWQTEENSEGISLLYTKPISEGYWHYRAVVKSGVCNNATSGVDSVFVKYAVGLDDIQNDTPKNILLTPNPSDGNVNLVCTEMRERNVEVSVSSLFGQKIMQKNMILKQGDNALNLSDLATGTYIIMVKGDNIDWTGKLIITKR